MKPHYPILDGLRGTAAIMVVIFHLYEALYIDYSIHPIHHGYLAVDFFFMLSGFVIGYAYDDRWGKMTTWHFFKARLIRLHPMVIFSTILGAICFWFDPYIEAKYHIDFLKLIGITLIGITLLPTPDVRGWDETHSLNGPLWSLLQEYIANILYVFIGRYLGKMALWIVVIATSVWLAYAANMLGSVASGWAYGNFWMGLTRMAFPFFAGLLLFRAGKLISIPKAYLLCSLALVVIFMLPYFKYNGLFEAACIIFIFPLIIAAGAGSSLDSKWAKLCKFSGDISYPLYIIHYPGVYYFLYWINATKPSPTKMLTVGIGLFILFITVAYAALKLYDEPVRNWLKQKFLRKA
ncbi:acyltransferase family protein [Mucilaginibacter terrae]|uniref:Peptidoglycan/LPS O-acetylase OafA/YrhL n=1 Tax=Mucilaginibacter terrae TaxID=1955052 RepID=A0ABU3GST4_9SPHI|nr:acyltransferase [Mucilaginibacter terrae]MDT3402685.1 peptidoglycan/LPS O-acetylase OafA/YrhL [Mucilaginibacter terrae]